jgi:hypothetical protein
LRVTSIHARSVFFYLLETLLKKHHLPVLDVAIAIAVNAVATSVGANPIIASPSNGAAKQLSTAPGHQVQQAPQTPGIPKEPYVSATQGAAKYTTEPAHQAQILQRPNLIAGQKQSFTAEFFVRNAGYSGAPASTARVTCTAYDAQGGSPTPCVEGTHFLVGFAGPRPTGTTLAGNVWSVPTPALAAGGSFEFRLGIISASQQRKQGLSFRICADAGNATTEISEADNCATFNYTWPN